MISDLQILGRFGTIADLPAADGRYHRSCAANFQAGYGKPKKYDTKTPYPARKRRHTTESPQAAASQPDFSRLAAFLDVANNFENSESGIEKMDALIQEMGKKADPYGVSHMKEQLRLHFDNNVKFSG